MRPEVKRRWRDYRTAAGRRPVKGSFDALSDTDAAAVVAAMKDVRETGLTAARRLRGEIYEVRADGDRQRYRIPVRSRRAAEARYSFLEEDPEDAARENPAC